MKLIQNLTGNLDAVKNNLAFTKGDQTILSKYPQEMFEFKEFDFLYYADTDTSTSIFKNKQLIQFLASFPEAIYINDNITLKKELNEEFYATNFIIKQDIKKEYLAAKLCLNAVLGSLKTNLDFEYNQPCSIDFMHYKKDNLTDFLNVLAEIENSTKEIKHFASKIFSNERRIIENIDDFAFDILLPQIINPKTIIDASDLFTKTQDKEMQIIKSSIQREHQLWKKEHKITPKNNNEQNSSVINDFLNEKIDLNLHKNIAELYKSYQNEKKRANVENGGCLPCRLKSLNLKYTNILKQFNII